MDKRTEIARVAYQLLNSPFPWEEVTADFQEGFKHSKVVNELLALLDE